MTIDLGRVTATFDSSLVRFRRAIFCLSSRWNLVLSPFRADMLNSYRLVNLGLRDHNSSGVALTSGVLDFLIIIGEAAKSASVNRSRMEASTGENWLLRKGVNMPTIERKSTAYAIFAVKRLRTASMTAASDTMRQTGVR